MSAQTPRSLFRQMVEESTPDHPIDVNRIRSVCLKGLGSLDPSPFDRYYAWLILTRVYPPSHTEWPEVLAQLMEQYQSYVKYFGKEDWHKKQVPVRSTIDDFVGDDQDMGWIHGDIIRSGRQCYFLGPRPILSPQSEPEPDDFLFEFQEHLRRLERILFVYAKLNPGLGYMQGFNELTIPFYYVMMQPFYNKYNPSDMSEEDLDRVECLTFHCFQHLMTRTELRDLYTTQDSSSIIVNRLNAFENLISKKLPKVGALMKEQDIHPIFYALRWFTVVFSQEHDFPALLDIWDSSLSHFDKFLDYLFYLGLAHIKVSENAFGCIHDQTIATLQDMKVSGKIKEILEMANKYWIEDKMDEGGHCK